MDTKEKWQEIANRGLQDRFDPETRAKFDEAVRRGLITMPEQQQAPQFQSESEIPIAEEIRLPFKPKPAQEPTLAEELIGGLEGAATMTSGAIAAPIAGIVGLAEAAYPFSEPGAGGRRAQQIQEALTIKPTKGAEMAMQPLQAVGEKIESARRYFGEDTLQATGSPLLATMASILPDATMSLFGVRLGKPSTQQPSIPKGTSKLQSATKQKIGELIQEGSKDVSTAKFKVAPNTVLSKITDGAPRVVGDATAKTTIKQGFDPAIVAMVKGSNNIDKAGFSKMVEITKKSLKNAEFGAKNRASDVLGDSFLKRINQVSKANRKAGGRLDRVAKSLKGSNVDSSPAVTQFLKDLKNKGVTVTEDLKLGFKGSDFEGASAEARSAQSILRTTFNRMSNTRTPDAFDLHRMKKFLDSQVSFGKSKSGMPGVAEGTLKSLRRNIDEILDNNFPEYDKVNTVFAETRTALDNLQDAAGKKLSFTGGNANKALGTKLRSLLSNNQSRVKLMDSVNEMENLSIKHGGNFKDNLLAQALFVDELENVFKTSARTGFKGQIAEAAVDVATGSPLRATLGAGKAAVSKITGKSPDKALEAIKQLIKEIK